MYAGSLAQLCLTLWDPMDCSPSGSSVHGVFLARTGVGCHSLLQGIFLIQGSNLVSCIAGRFFTIWATSGGLHSHNFVDLFFWPPCATCGIIVPPPAIEPKALPVEALNPSHWTTKEFPQSSFKMIVWYFSMYLYIFSIINKTRINIIFSCTFLIVSLS